MAIVEHERPAPLTEVEELERLWDVEPRDARPARTLRDHGPLLNRALLVAWIAFVVSVFFEPVPNPDAHVSAWAYGIEGAFWLTLLASGVLAKLRRTPAALEGACLAGAFGVAVAVNCHTTQHHLGGWWIYEVVATVGLLALGFAALTAARARANG